MPLGKGNAILAYPAETVKRTNMVPGAGDAQTTADRKAAEPPAHPGSPIWSPVQNTNSDPPHGGEGRKENLYIYGT